MATTKAVGPPILVDRRVGSQDLYPLLLRAQVPTDLTTLPFGDCAFIGNGPDGPAPVGIERKRIRDLVQSLMSNRLAGHQLPGIVGQYPHAWVVVEGPWRVNRDTGLVDVPPFKGKTWVPIQPQISGSALRAWLLTLELRGGIRVMYTRDADDTVHWLTALYSWWTAKQWQDHRSHLALYQPPDAALFVKPRLVRRVAAELPGIGFDRSADVDKAFGTVLEMACADAKTWRRIPGIGDTIAARVVRALQEPN